MYIKLFDSELKVMDILWKEGALPAKSIAGKLKETIDWNKNTTYTVIKKCIEKGAIERIEPNFVCKALITKEEAQEIEVNELLGKLFDGSAEMLFASLVGRKQLPADTKAKLQQMIDSMED